MDYNQLYASITNNAKNRILTGYKEGHHIIPLSLGGLDVKDNIVDLTAREHFLCHWLLVKIHKTGEEHFKMLNALRMMRAENSNQKRYQSVITARVYEKLKEEYSRLQSEKVIGKNNPMYGREVSEELRRFRSEMNKGDKNPAKKESSRKKISEAKTGKKRSTFNEEWRAKMSASKQGKNNNRFGVTLNEETRKKIGDKIRGRKQTEEEKLRRGLANKGSKRERLDCPHCHKNVAVNIYARYHGDRCKII